MPLRPHVAFSYPGLVVSGLVGGIGLGGLSAMMFLFRPQAEPILRIALQWFAALNDVRLFQYDPDTYFLFAATAGLAAVLWVAGMARAIIKKPAYDARVDAALASRHGLAAHGAPLEPE